MTISDRLDAPGPKKLLALDGGGIRGLLTIEVLAEVERVLQRRLGRDDRFTLADYFDYVAGTSTGAILATCLALGMRVDEIRAFYLENGKRMFDKASLLRRFRYKYEDDALAAKLREVVNAYRTGEDGDGDLTLGSAALRTLLLVVMRNATTDSPWPVSNNPKAKYNDPERADSNLRLPLWKLVRASTAAPVYFPPEVVRVGPHEFVFVDGGITPYNNPSFLLFLMATAGPYNLRWATGPDEMLLVSIGTGAAADANADLRPEDMNLLYNAGSIPSALMYGASVEQDLLCRVFSRCRAGDALDREVGALLDTGGGSGLPPLFTYARYNADLSRAGLDALGLGDVEPAHVQKLDSVAHMDALRRVGEAVARREVRPEHFDGFVPVAVA